MDPRSRVSGGLAGLSRATSLGKVAASPSPWMDGGRMLSGTVRDGPWPVGPDGRRQRHQQVAERDEFVKVRAGSTPSDGRAEDATALTPLDLGSVSRALAIAYEEMAEGGGQLVSRDGLSAPGFLMLRWNSGARAGSSSQRSLPDKQMAPYRFATS